jgi:hypothetical protein
VYTHIYNTHVTCTNEHGKMVARYNEQASCTSMHIIWLHMFLYKLINVGFGLNIGACKNSYVETKSPVWEY